MRSQWTTQQAYTPPMTPVIFRLLVLFGAAFIIEKMAALALGSAALLLDSRLALHFGSGFLWTQILTHPFFSGAPLLSGLINLFFEGVILWSFGSDLERLWGSYIFLKFFLVALMGGALLSLLLAYTLLPGLVVAGFGAGLTAVLVAYAIIWPDRQVLFFMVIPMRMKWLILILLVFLALGSPISLVLYSGGALAGALFIFYYARRGRLQQGYIITSASGKKRVMGSPAEKVREYFRKRRLRKKQAEIQERINMKDEVDRLLEKISKEGIGSLTRKEKAFLDRASKEF